MKRLLSLFLSLVCVISYVAIPVHVHAEEDVTAPAPAGDMNGDGVLDSADAIYLLRHSLFPEGYTLACEGDTNGDGFINSDDTIHLLRHILIPENYPIHSHYYSDWQIVTAPTCKDEGLSEAFCSCGKKQTQVEDKLTEHTWDEGTITTAPGCASEGVRTFTCTVCFETKTASVPATNNHTWDQGTVTTDPTCTKEGVMTFDCIDCDATTTQPIAATGIHLWDDGVITTDPSCDKDGVRTHTCSCCGTTTTTSIPATNDHDWNEGVITADPTCTEEGVKTFTCNGCGTTKTEAVDATGVHLWDDGVITVNPTCNAEGEKTFTCSSCGGTRTESVGITDQHTYNGGVITTAATCAKEGVKTYTCTTCSTTKTETIAKTTTHTPNGGTVTKAATCKETGTKTYNCTVCGVVTKTETIAKTSNHTWNGGSITTQPTADATGVKTYTCTTCGATKTESVAKLQLSFTSTGVTTTPLYGTWQVNLSIKNPSSKFKNDAWIGIYPTGITDAQFKEWKGSASLSTWTYAFHSKYTTGLSASNRPSGTSFTTSISSDFFTSMASSSRYYSSHPYGAICGGTYDIVLFYTDTTSGSLNGYEVAARVTVKLGNSAPSYNYGFGITGVTSNKSANTWKVEIFLKDAPASPFWKDAWVGIYPTNITQDLLYQHKGQAGLGTWCYVWSDQVERNSGEWKFSITQANISNYGTGQTAINTVNINYSKYPYGPVIGDEFFLILFYSDGASGNGYAIAKMVKFKL